MTALQTWSSFGELEWFHREFDDMFDRFTKDLRWGGMTTFTPPIESYVEGNQLHIRANLPGVDPKQVEITVANDRLTIRGKRERHRERNDQGWLHRETAYGSFERTLELPAGVNADQITALYHNGVMELTMPLPASAVERKVPIELAASGAQQIGNEPSGSEQNPALAKAA
jgi:HSP20 family protein